MGQKNNGIQEAAKEEKESNLIDVLREWKARIMGRI